MRFAATERRTGAAFLWCALIVLAWALFSVLFGGSAAHADDRGRDGDARPKAVISQAHKVAQRAHDVVRPSTDAHAARAAKPVHAVPAAKHSSIAAKKTAGAEHASTADAVKIPAPVATAKTPKSVASAVAAKIGLRPHKAASDRPSHPHADAARGVGHKSEAHPRGHAIPAHAAAQAHEHARAAITPAHAAPAPRAPHTAGATAPTDASATTASATTGETSAQPQQTHVPSPGEAHSLSGPPATPSSAASAVPGAAPTAALLPDTTQPDLWGAIMTALRALDDALPSGPVGSTDVSPD